MFFGTDIQSTRQLFFSSWDKHRQKQSLLPLEQQIVDVIIAHPEYQKMFEGPKHSEQAYFPELGGVNPFLHMGLHLAIRDQVRTNRPMGITPIYQQLLQVHLDPLAVEHLMMDCLAECLWCAQRQQSAPDEEAYILSLQQMIMHRVD